MTLCPKCGQTSTNDRICSNCWADMTAKPRKPKPKIEMTDQRIKTVLLWAVIFLAFGYLMSLLGRWMGDSTKGPQGNGSVTVNETQ